MILNETTIQIFVWVFLYIPMCLLGLWALGIVYFWLMGDIIEHKLKVREAKQRWKKE